MNEQTTQNQPRKKARNQPKAQAHFAVDRDGLAALVAGRGKGFAVCELVQNAWDQDVSRVTITLEPVPGKPLARLVVEDDDPDGFADLSDAYTLFAASRKKADPRLRGRFNLGEKLVIALCAEATIASTTGTVVFNDDGRRRYPRRRLERGSRFEGLLRVTRDELPELERTVERLLPPAGVHTSYNGMELRARTPLRTFDATLPTVIADAEGVLRPTKRKTTVRVFEPLRGEPATLYELGIPVVETDGRWDVDVAQKVPLGTDRDNVTPAYRRELHAAVLNAMADELDAAAATGAWASQALEDPSISAAAVTAVVTARYGDRCVTYDPSDPEANKLAVSHGYEVIGAGSFNAKQWNAIRSARVALPAGRVTPSPKPYSDDPNAPQRAELDPSDWTQGMTRVAAFAATLGERLTGVRPEVLIINDHRVPALATYGRGRGGPTLELNAARLGHAWFEQPPASEPVLDLVIHELGHHYESDHLSRNYYRALTRLGARLTHLALDEPELFERDTAGVERVEAA